MKITPWLVFTPVALLALFTSIAGAEPVDPITVTVWDNRGYNQSPPLPPTTPIAGVTTAVDIWHNFDQQPMFNLYEDFIVRYDTNVVLDTAGWVRFMALADDGTKILIDGDLIADDWVDKGGGGSESSAVWFDAGVSRQLTVWYYENGGAAWLDLWYQVDELWSRVPMSVFRADPVVPAPTTTTTELVTTTTEMITTTTTTLPPTTTTTTTTLPPTTTTEITTTTVPPTTTTEISTTTTTTTLPPTTTTEISTTTVPPTTVPPPTTTTPISEILQNEIDSDTAASLATDSALMEQIDSEQAQQIFDAIDLDELSDSAAAAIVAAVQNAPDTVREAFEEEIDIYAGKTDDYIPLGSLVNVATRRVLVVSVAFTMVTPMPASRRS